MYSECIMCVYLFNGSKLEIRIQTHKFTTHTNIF